MDQPLRRFDRVTVFGGATIDRIARSTRAPVMGASNPGHARRLPGGVGFNVASILARLGVGARLVTRVGADVDGEAIVAAAGAAGIDTTAIGVSQALPTAAYHAAFDERGDLIIGIADMEVCDEMTPQAVGGAAASGHEDFWVVDANLPEDTLAFLAEQAVANGNPLAALTVSPAKAVRLTPLLNRIGYLFANRREAAVLLGRDPNSAGASGGLAAELARTRTTKVVVTSGNDPVFVAASADARSFLPLRTDVRSSTAPAIRWPPAPSRR